MNANIVLAPWVLGARELGLVCLNNVHIFAYEIGPQALLLMQIIALLFGPRGPK